MKITNYAMTVAMGLLMLTSCSEDQSTFDIQKVPGRCVIEGVVKFNEGTTLQDGHFSYTYKPAADLDITIVVNNSEYGNLEGYSTFTTTTDAEGKYSIELPAPLRNASVEILTADFRGVRTVITQENNQIVSKKEDVIFRGKANATIHSEGIVYANVLCTSCNVNTSIEGLSQLATIKGKIGQGVEYKVAPEKKYILNENEEKEFVGYSNARLSYVFDGAKADLIVNVNYNGENFTYNVTSDSNGEWTLDVPVEMFPASFSYSLTAMPYDANYTHYVPVEKTYTLNSDEEDAPLRTYVDYEARSIKGFYSQEFNASFNANFPVSAQVCSSKAKIMVFKGLEGQDLYGYNYDKYDSNCLWRSELIEQLEQEETK